MKSRIPALFYAFALLSLPPLTHAGSLTQSNFSYLSSTPEIHYLVTVNRKTIVSASLQVIDVGDAAPAGHEVSNAELIAQKNVPSSFSFSKPDSGWPEGSYKLIIKDNDNVIDSAVFYVIADSDAAIVSQPQSTQSPSAQPQTTQSSQTLAQGAGGVLTLDAAHAYVDALEFVHTQMGQPQQFRGQDRQTVIDGLAASFPTFAYDTQNDLSNARSLLNEYQSSWHYLSADQQTAFAYSVLAVAYGESAASQALGYNTGSGGGGGNTSYYSDGASFVSDGDCAYFSSDAGSVSTCD